MPVFKVEVSRSVNYYESAYTEIEANSIEDAKEIAIEMAQDGLLDFNGDEFPIVDYEVFEEGESE